MKLNLYILRDDLAEYVVSSRLITEKTALGCAGARIYRPGLPLSEGIIFVSHAENLSEEPDFEGTPALVCIGEPPQAYLDAPIDILVMDSSLSTAQVMDLIAKLEIRYEEWDSKLKDILLNGGTLAQLGEVSQPVFENPLYCQGGGFNVIFLCMGDLDKATEEQKEHIATVLGKYEFEPDTKLSEQTIIRLFTMDDYLKADTVTGLYYYDNKVSNTSGWCFNVGSDGAHFGRIIDFEIYRDVNDRDAALIYHLAPYVEHMLRARTLESAFDTDTMFHCVSDMLSGTPVSQATLRFALHEMDWDNPKEDELYFCMAVEPASGDITSLGLQEIAAHINPLLPTHYHIVFNKKLILIFNLTKAHMTYEEVSALSLPILRDVLLRAGTSNPFGRFDSLHYYYKQALEALSFGLGRDPDHWHFRYEDYSLEILLGRCTKGMPAQVLMPRGLRRLHVHDEERGTHLVETLRLYLRHNMSVTETARASYSSRSTTIRHLQQILDISSLDLDNPDVRLELCIAFAALDRQKLA